MYAIRSYYAIILYNFAPETALVQILDQLGEIVFEENVATKTGDIAFSRNLSYLRPSVYHIRIVSGTTILNKKISYNFV